VIVNTLKQNAFALNVNIKVPKVETDEKSVKGGN
jgi:hypothetical protein